MTHRFHLLANAAPCISEATLAKVPLPDADLATVSGGGVGAGAWGNRGVWYGGMVTGACIGGPVGAILGAPV